MGLLAFWCRQQPALSIRPLQHRLSAYLSPLLTRAPQDKLFDALVPGTQRRGRRGLEKRFPLPHW